MRHDKMTFHGTEVYGQWIISGGFFSKGARRSCVVSEFLLGWQESSVVHFLNFHFIIFFFQISN